MTESTRKGLSRRQLLGAGLGGLTLVGGGAEWAADRFLIEHAEVTDASALYQNAAATSAASSASSTATSSASASAGITVRTITSGSGSTQVTSFVADVRLTTGTALRSAFAKDTFGNNVIEVPSAMAQRAGAVLAINGDYYGFRSTGIEIRNGAIFRDKGARQGLAYYRDGSMTLYDETATTATKLLADGVWHTVSFGPGLVDAGHVLTGIDSIEIDTNIGNHSIQGYQPRTGIGMVEANHLVFVVVDGRSTGYSRGMTMPELAQFMADQGCQVAYNLDGGGSSAMWYSGDIINRPGGSDNERGTSDILYVGA